MFLMMRINYGLGLVLCVATLGLLGGCSSIKTDTAAANPSSTANTCHAKQKKVDGSCCPAGTFYDFAGDSCQLVGPPECADILFSNPEKCAPKWCWDWQHNGQTPCKAFSEGCETVPRLCSAAEIAAGSGCAAGTFPVSDKIGDCAAAGFFPGSGVPRDGAGDPLLSLPAMTDVDDSFFCQDSATQQPRFCTAKELEVCHRGANGQMPADKMCLYAGVPWPSVCPPGFVVDATAKVLSGQLPPCLPDPADCSDDEYGDAALSEGDGVVFVNAASGSDSAQGSRAAPFRTIGKALTEVGPGDTIAVAAGKYIETLSIHKPLNLFGRCAAMVRLEFHGGVTTATVSVSGIKLETEVFLRGISIGGSGYGVEVLGKLPVALERVHVSGATAFGLTVDGAGASLRAESVVVTGTLPVPTSHTFGRGLDIENGGHAALTDVRLTANTDLGLYAMGAATSVTAVRLLVDGTLARASNLQFGQGIFAHLGAAVALQNVRVSANRTVGVYLFDKGTSLDAQGLVVDGTLAQQSDKRLGRGLTLQAGAHAQLQACRLTANRDIALSMDDTGTTLQASLLLVDGTLPQANDNQSGRGINAQYGATMVLHNTRLHENREIGLYASGGGTEVIATQLVVDGTLAQVSDKTLGRGVAAQSGAKLQLSDVLLSANRHVGVSVSDEGTELVATRLLVTATLPQDHDQRFGWGIAVQAGAFARVVASRICNTREAGLFASAASVVLFGVSVCDTRFAVSDKTGGSAIWLAAASNGTITASTLTGNQGVALAVDQSHVQVRDSVALLTTSSQYSEITSAGTATGTKTTMADGVLLHAAVNASIEQCLLSGNLRAGMLVESSPHARIARSLFDGTKGSYGLVIQHTLDAILLANASFGAAVQDRANDAGLSLPAPPEPVEAIANAGKAP